MNSTEILNSLLNDEAFEILANEYGVEIDDISKDFILKLSNGQKFKLTLKEVK